MKKTKKQPVESQLDDINLDVKKLSPSQYWEWRCTIEELKSSDLNFKRVILEQKVKELEIELRKKELAVFKEVIINASNEKDNLKKEYDVFKEKLEKEIGCSLSNCVIDDITYEIKKIEV